MPNQFARLLLRNARLAPVCSRFPAHRRAVDSQLACKIARQQVSTLQHRARSGLSDPEVVRLSVNDNIVKPLPALLPDLAAQQQDDDALP